LHKNCTRIARENNKLEKKAAELECKLKEKEKNAGNRIRREKMFRKEALASKELLEKLASLEHRQWVEWSREVASTEVLHRARIERWNKLWVPYSKLPEHAKEQDRKYAKRVLKCLAKYKQKSRA